MRECTGGEVTHSLVISPTALSHGTNWGSHGSPCSSVQRVRFLSTSLGQVELSNTTQENSASNAKRARCGTVIHSSLMARTNTRGEGPSPRCTLGHVKKLFVMFVTVLSRKARRACTSGLLNGAGITGAPIRSSPKYRRSTTAALYVEEGIRRRGGEKCMADSLARNVCAVYAPSKRWPRACMYLEQDMGAREEEGQTHLAGGGVSIVGCMNEEVQELHKPAFAQVENPGNGPRTSSVGRHTFGQERLHLTCRSANGFE